MTLDEAIKHEAILHKEKVADSYHRQLTEWLKDYKRLREQEPKAEEFAKWVATEIFDENWEYNKDAFAELACRRLAKMGIVRAKGDEWELVESKESEE